MGSEGCLLVVVIDVHPQLAEVEQHAHTYLDACISFANLHLASNVRNTLAVIAANHQETRFLYPRTEGEQVMW